MLLLILYFIFNFLGFLVFYRIWLWLDKPEPYDYTTIPGLKCQDLGMKRKDIQIPVDYEKRISTLSESTGNLVDIKEHATVSDFLHHLLMTFGPLAAFYWGPRYVVSIGDKDTLEQIRKFKDGVYVCNFFAFASILLNDQDLFNISTIDSVDLEYQHNLFLNYDTLNYSKSVKSNCLIRPKVYDNVIVLLFDVEIELNAHPIPEHVPMICDLSLILRSCNEEDVQWLEDFLDIDNRILKEISGNE